MRLIVKTIPAAARNLLQSLDMMKGVVAVFLSLAYLLALACMLIVYAVRIVIVWPLIFLTVIAAVIAVAVPVLMLADPLLTPDAIAHALLRVLHIVPLMWGPLALLGLLSDVIPVLWRQYSRFPVKVREMWDLLSGRNGVREGAGRGGDLTHKQGG